MGAEPPRPDKHDHATLTTDTWAVHGGNRPDQTLLQLARVLAGRTGTVGLVPPGQPVRVDEHRPGGSEPQGDHARPLEDAVVVSGASGLLRVGARRTGRPSAAPDAVDPARLPVPVMPVACGDR
jgi:hypothetical protein